MGETFEVNLPFEMMAKDFQGYFYCFLFGSDFRSDVQLRHLLKVPSMLRMLHNMIQHEYVFLHKLEMLKHHVIWCIYFFGKSNHHFYWKVDHHPKEPLFLIWWQRLPGYVYGSPLVLCTSILQRCCCSKCEGHFGQLKKIAFVLSRIFSPKTNMAMEGWSSGSVCPVFCCSFCWVLSTQMSHFCPTKDFQMMIAGVSPAAMEEWTQWMRKKRAVLHLCGHQFGQRSKHGLIDGYIIVVYNSHIKLVIDSRWNCFVTVVLTFIFILPHFLAVALGGGGPLRFPWQDQSTTLLLTNH